jgi:hypothetical protein
MEIYIALTQEEKLNLIEHGFDFYLGSQSSPKPTNGHLSTRRFTLHAL